jgi:F-type H+-transporting ATPase subunit b
MRTRQILCGLGVLTLALLGPSVAAHAQTEGGGESTEEIDFADDAAEECFELLEEGKSVDDCQEAPSPILPATNELIWATISFFVLLGLMAKFAFPALKKGLEDRTERIRADVDAAEGAKAAAEAKASEYDAKLAEAKHEAARIIEEARQDADRYRGEKRSEVDAEIVRMREQAQADIESSKAQAIADIRGEVASLAIAAAEQVVAANLDRDANLALVEQFIDSVGATGTN